MLGSSWQRVVAVGVFALFAATVRADDFSARPEVAAFKAELVREHGFDAAALDALFARVRRNDRVLALMEAPIKAPVPWYVYWPRHIGGDRLARGTAFMRQNREVFDRAEAAYGVPASVIAAIIGVETVYGRMTGDFRVVDSLATLAFDYPRREAYFREQLKELLLLAREQQKSPFDYVGSFAGAMGWPQFMPGSWRRWAVDFDGDGRIDLWRSAPDIIGSVASFLGGHGWQRGEPVMLPVAKPSAAVLATFEGGLAPRKTLKDYLAEGIRITARDADVTLPADDAQVGLISLDRADGSDEYWLAFENFYVITRYNRSRMYASSVWSLAYALHAALTPAKRAP